MNEFSVREQIIEVVNKLFIYTDYQQWQNLENEVFSNMVQLDMTSMGGTDSEISAKAICEMWDAAFKELDAVNHLGGNYLVTINGNTADVFAYATATHYKKSAKKGTTREFTGSYGLHLKKTVNGWRIDRMKYNLKYASGNLDLK